MDTPAKLHLGSRLVERAFRLQAPDTRDLRITRDIRVPMPDGVVLLADRWAPASGGDGLPVLLIRTPYGRRGIMTLGLVRPFAERGFQVVVQSARGTFGSGGEWAPMRHERDDGLATLDWLVAQPWAGDAIVLAGGSYMGYVQWAVCDALPPQVKAMVPQITESAISLEFLRPDGFSLETPFLWGVTVDRQERPAAIVRQLLGARKVRAALTTVPLAGADMAALGHHDPYVQSILEHDGDDPYWQPIDHRHRVGSTSVPVSSIGGWYDLFLPGQLRDFEALVAAGVPARLTVGPWVHTASEGAACMAREVLDWAKPLALGEQPPDRAPVRLYVMGAGEWRDFPSWPPPGYEPQRWHLWRGGALGTAPPPDSDPARYRYDPADPTPAVGGVRMVTTLSRNVNGRARQNKLEERADVLVYTSDVLDRDVEVVGPVRAEIWFQSSLPHADVFVRLCDVDDSGTSTNVCDGLTSIENADSISCVHVELWPTAYRFPRGHRIRVQVSSGSFPRYARNHGTGEPRATATTMRAADQAVFHDPAHPSAVLLRVATRSPGQV